MKTELSPEKIRELLTKARKGADSSFGPAQWAAVFTAIGWTPETILGEKRAVVGFRVVTSNGHVITVEKEANHRALFFYSGTFDGKDWGRLATTDEDGVYSWGVAGNFQTLLKEHTTWLADVDKVLGPVPTAVDFQRPGAPHCPVCRRDILLDDDHKMVHHGYSRPGIGYIVGDCFGVKYEPWEVSPKGAEDYLARVLRPYLKRAEERLAALEAGEVTAFTVTEGKYEGNRRVEVDVIITAASDEKRFAKLLASDIKATQGRIGALKADIARFESDIAGWKAQPLPEYTGPVKMLHFEVKNRKPGRTGTAGACVMWAMRPKYVVTTPDASAVTCKRCLKLIAETEARATAKAVQTGVAS